MIASSLLRFGLGSIIQSYRWLTYLWRKREFGTSTNMHKCGLQTDCANMRTISSKNIIIFKLIQRFYELDGGDLTIQNEKLKNINLAWLRSQIGIVSQVIALDYWIILVWTWARAQKRNSFFVTLKTDIFYLTEFRDKNLISSWYVIDLKIGKNKNIVTYRFFEFFLCIKA